MSVPTTHITTCLLPLLLLYAVVMSICMLTADAKSMTIDGQHPLRHEKHRQPPYYKLEDTALSMATNSSMKLRSRRRSIMSSDESSSKRSVDGYYGEHSNRTITGAHRSLTIFITPRGFRGINAKSNASSVFRVRTVCMLDNKTLHWFKECETKTMPQPRTALKRSKMLVFSILYNKDGGEELTEYLMCAHDGLKKVEPVNKNSITNKESMKYCVWSRHNAGYPEAYLIYLYYGGNMGKGKNRTYYVSIRPSMTKVVNNVRLRSLPHPDNINKVFKRKPDKLKGIKFYIYDHNDPWTNASTPFPNPAFSTATPPTTKKEKPRKKPRKHCKNHNILTSVDCKKRKKKNRGSNLLVGVQRRGETLLDQEQYVRGSLLDSVSTPET